MTVYAATAVIAIVTLAAAGFGAASAWISVATLAVGAGWNVSYLVQRRGSLVPEHRRRLDRFVFRQWLLTGTLGLGGSLLIVAFDFAPLKHVSSFFHALIVGIVVASLIVFVSSLVDWYWILPKVSGIVCPGPCESPGRERWTLVTCHWFFHRAAATAAFACSAAGIPLYMLSTAGSGRGVAGWFVVTGAVSALVAVNNNQIVRAFRYSLNPPVHVGDVITVRVDEGDQVTARKAYIVDVSLQGSKFKILDDEGRYVGPPFVQKSDAPPIDLETLEKARRHSLAAPLCKGGQCSGVNWYCRNNLLAYNQSPR